MYRVTTPTHTFTLPIDTSECDVIQVTYKQGEKTLIKEYSNGTIPSGMSLNEDDVVIALTQEETKSFKEGYVDAQIRVLTTGGKAFASQHFKVAVNQVNNEAIL